MSNILTRHQAVLDVDVRTVSSAYVRFAHPESAEVHHVTRADWEDMGRPDQITISVVPGDALND